MLCCAAGNHLAEDQRRNGVGQAEHGIHVVLDQQDGQLTAQAFQQGHHVLGFVWPHAGHRLIEQQQLGLCGQCQAQLQLALFAVRQRAGNRVHTRTQSNPLGQRCGLGVTLALSAGRRPKPEAAAAAGLHRECDVVHHGQALEDAGNLVRTDQTDARALVHGHGGDILPAETNNTFIGLQSA